MREVSQGRGVLLRLQSLRPHPRRISIQALFEGAVVRSDQFQNRRLYGQQIGRVGGKVLRSAPDMQESDANRAVSSED